MKNKKKALLFGCICLLLVVVTMTFVTACGEEETAPAATTAQPAAAAPAETYEITFATFESDTHYQVPLMNWFAEELDKRTDGKTETTVFTGGALGSAFELQDNIVNGIADMGYVYMGLVSGHNPIYDIFEIPLLMKSPGAEQYVAWDLYTRGYLDIEGTKALQFHGMEPTKLYTASKKINTVEDLKGLVVHVGSTYVNFCNKLGISSVQLDHPDIYTSVEKGVVDGGLAGIGLPKSMNMADIIDYVMWNNIVSGVHPCLINEAKWNSLPADVQVAMLELSREMDGKLVEAAYLEEAACYDYFTSAGVEVYSLSDAEWAKVEALSDAVASEWAAEVDAQGYPATEVLEIVMQDLAALGLR